VVGFLGFKVLDVKFCKVYGTDSMLEIQDRHYSYMFLEKIADLVKLMRKTT